LTQLVKVFSFVLVFGLSFIPLKSQPFAHRATTAPAAMAATSVVEAPSTSAIRLDDRTSADWETLQKALQAEYDAAQAKEAADAAAAQLAAAPRGGYAPPAAPRPSVGYVQDLIRQAFGPQGQAAVDWGLRVAACESGYNPNAYNPDGASGVFQFMPGTFRATPYGNQNIFDAAANVNAAAWYFQQHGGGAWSCK
jgi:soluble lytic murein transglycosylase-like protein